MYCCKLRQSCDLSQIWYKAEYRSWHHNTLPWCHCNFYWHCFTSFVIFRLWPEFHARMVFEYGIMTRCVQNGFDQRFRNWRSLLFNKYLWIRSTKVDKGFPVRVYWNLKWESIQWFLYHGSIYGQSCTSLPP